MSFWPFSSQGNSARSLLYVSVNGINIHLIRQARTFQTPFWLPPLPMWNLLPRLLSSEGLSEFISSSSHALVRSLPSAPLHNTFLLRVLISERPHHHQSCFPKGLRSAHSTYLKVTSSLHEREGVPTQRSIARFLKETSLIYVYRSVNTYQEKLKAVKCSKLLMIKYQSETKVKQFWDYSNKNGCTFIYSILLEKNKAY